MRSQVCCVNGRHYVARRNRCLTSFLEEVTYAAKHVAAIVEGYGLQGTGQRYARFHVNDCQGISAHRNCERIEPHNIFVLIAKFPCRNNNLSRPCFLKTETT